MSRKGKTKKEWITYILNIKKDENDCILFRKHLQLDNLYFIPSRLIYENVIGPIPKEMVVRHKCHKICCCNPEHLYLKTRGDISNLNSFNRALSQETINKIKELRSQQKTTTEIKKILNISQATVSKYIVGMPLSEEKKKNIALKSAKYRGEKTKEKNRLLWEGLNKFKDFMKNQKYTTFTKGSIAEAAILYRLLIHNYEVYYSAFNGGIIDIIAHNTITGRLLKIQVKCAKGCKNSQTPIINLKKSKGRDNLIKYNNKEIDLIIGYDIYNDVAYVFTWDEIKNLKNIISATVESKENWNKLCEERSEKGSFAKS